MGSFKDKVVLVTGGNTGIGHGIVQAMAGDGPACIYLCARDQVKANAAIDAIMSIHPSTPIKFLSLDLADMSSVRACAEQFDQMSDRLDLLFLNAGVSSRSPSVTSDGYEVHFGINYLGHMLLTQLLMPKMLQTLRKDEKADVRVVALSSISAYLFSVPNGLALEQMKTPAAEVQAITRYGHSKLAIIMAIRELARLYPEILFASLCPGNVKTDLWRQTDGLGWFINYVLGPVMLFLTGISVEQAARLPHWCASAPWGKSDSQLQSGSFYHPAPGQLKDDNEHVKNRELREKLWKWTEVELGSHGGPGWVAAT